MWLVFAAVCNFIVLGVVGIAALVGASQKIVTYPTNTIQPITEIQTPSATPTSTELPCHVKLPPEYWDQYCDHTVPIYKGL
jgi:hypothetical protein